MELIGDPRAFAVQLDWDRRPTCKPRMHGVFRLHTCGERLDNWFQQLPEPPGG